MKAFRQESQCIRFSQGVFGHNEREDFSRSGSGSSGRIVIQKCLRRMDIRLWVPWTIAGITWQTPTMQIFKTFAGSK